MIALPHYEIQTETQTELLFPTHLTRGVGGLDLQIL